MLAPGFKHVSPSGAVVYRRLFLNPWHPNAGSDGFDSTPRGCPNRSNAAHPHQEFGLPSH